MTDPRPSENTDNIPQWPGFRAAGFFDDIPKGDDFFTEPEPDGPDPIENFIERALNAHEPAHGLVSATIAATRAMQAQTAVLTRIADAISNLHIDVDLGGQS